MHSIHRSMHFQFRVSQFRVRLLFACRLRALCDVVTRSNVRDEQLHVARYFDAYDECFSRLRHLRMLHSFWSHHFISFLFAFEFETQRELYSINIQMSFMKKCVEYKTRNASNHLCVNFRQFIEFVVWIRTKTNYEWINVAIFEITICVMHINYNVKQICVDWFDVNIEFITWIRFCHEFAIMIRQ